MDECRETEYRVENLDDQNGIFHLENEFEVPRVRIASCELNPVPNTVHDSSYFTAAQLFPIWKCFA